jgi:uncharacterized membrane protein
MGTGQGDAGVTGGGQAGPPALDLSGVARSGNLEYDRILFFNDAVFAIAITLLVVDLPMTAARSAASSGAELRAAVPGITSFVISFAVIGLFWIGQHGIFRYISAFDRKLILLNLVFLGTIAFLPYPTEVLGRASGTERPAVIFYAACCAAAGLTEGIAWFYATRPAGGLAPGITAQLRWRSMLQIARVPAVFGLSIPVAFVSPSLATYTWILILVTGAVLDRVVPFSAPV